MNGLVFENSPSHNVKLETEVEVANIYHYAELENLSDELLKREELKGRSTCGLNIK